MSGEYDTSGQDDTFGNSDNTGGSSDFGKTADLWSGYDQSGLSGQFHLPDVSSPAPAATPTSGVDFETPTLRPDTQGQYPILPIKGSPTSDYNYWNPASALDTLSAYSRLIPGVNDLGKRFADIGTNIANSDFGRTVSDSPLAKVGGFLGDMFTSATRGFGQTVSDGFSPIADHATAVQRGDLGGYLLNELRGPQTASDIASGDYLGAAGEALRGIAQTLFTPAGHIAGATSDRVDGALHGDAEMKQQLVDELSFMSLILPVAKGPALIAKLPFGGALASAGESAAAREAMHWATRAMLAGYTAEVTGDVMSRIDPQTEDLSKLVAAQRLVPDSSPFSGLYNFAAAGLVDPIPLLGKMSEFGPIRRVMDGGGALRLPWQGEIKMGGQLSDTELAQLRSQAIMNLAEKRVEARLDPSGDGPKVATAADVQREAQYIVDVDQGRAGAPGEYTRQHVQLDQTYDYMQRDMERARFNDRPATPAELAENWRQFENTKNLIQSAEEQVAGHSLTGPESHLAVRKDTLTTLDYDRAAADMKAVVGAANKSLSPDALAQLKQDHPGVFEDLGFKMKGKILEEIAARRHFAPHEPAPAIGSSVSVPRTEEQIAAENGTVTGKQASFNGDIEAAIRERESRGLTSSYAGGVSANPMVDVAQKVRAMGQFKVIEKGGNYVALSLDHTVQRGHPFWREASQVAGGSQKLTDLLHDAKTTRETATMQQIIDALSKDHPKITAQTFDRFTRPGRGYYTESGAEGNATVVRPVLWSDTSIANQVKGSSTKLGRFVSGFRQYLPSAQLARDMYDSQFATWNKRTGATRAEFEKLWDAFGQAAKDKGLTHTEQLQGVPPNVATEINTIAQKVLGSKANGINAAQVLAEGMPRENLKQMIGQMTGQGVGRVGVGPSAFGALRSAGSGQAGDLWRWMASVGHPLIRYTASPVWNAFVKLESPVFNFMNGAKWAPRDGILRDTVNAYMKPVTETFAGKSGGLGHEAVSAETMASEATAGGRGKAETLLARRMEYMADQATTELPKEYGRQMQQQMPQVWKDVRSTVGSDREAVEQFLNDQKVRRDFMSGNMSSEDMAKYAGLTTPESMALYMPLARRLEDSLQKVYVDAQTTHISNPMRSYWERSINHPALVYPLSWSMKALGEWAKFLTHSAFGLPTRMGGLVAYNDVMDATQKVLANDPETQRFMERHPETMKVLAYLMPGTPMTGVGYGVGGNVKTILNVGKAISEGKNPVDQVNWGVIRDGNALSKAWSEWVLNRPRTKLDRPGI